MRHSFIESSKNMAATDAFAYLTLGRTTDDAKVEILGKSEKTLLVRVDNNGVEHFELYWILECNSDKDEETDLRFCLGRNIIVKVFYFNNPVSADLFRQIVLENEKSDPSSYYYLHFGARMYLTKNPYCDQSDLQYLLEP